jgi:hypothetical protein
MAGSFCGFADFLLCEKAVCLQHMFSFWGHYTGNEGRSYLTIHPPMGLLLRCSDLSEKETEQFAPLAGDILGLLTPEDIEQVASDIPNKCSAGVLVFEHTWAIGLKEAIKNSGGIPVAGGLVAPDVLKELEEELDAAKRKADQKQAIV